LAFSLVHTSSFLQIAKAEETAKLLTHKNTISKLIFLKPDDAIKVFERCEHYHRLFPGIKKSLKLSANSCYLEGYDKRFWIQISIKTFRLSQNQIVVKSRMIKGYPKMFESEALIEPTNLKNQSKITLGMKANFVGLPQIFVDKAIQDVTKRTLDKLFTQTHDYRF
jgi:hypothetical protein